LKMELISKTITATTTSNASIASARNRLPRKLKNIPKWNRPQRDILLLA